MKYALQTESISTPLKLVYYIYSQSKDAKISAYVFLPQTLSFSLDTGVIMKYLI